MAHLHPLTHHSGADLFSNLPRPPALRVPSARGARSATSPPRPSRSAPTSRSALPAPASSPSLDDGEGTVPSADTFAGVFDIDSLEEDPRLEDAVPSEDGHGAASPVVRISRTIFEYRLNRVMTGRTSRARRGWRRFHVRLRHPFESCPHCYCSTATLVESGSRSPPSASTGPSLTQRVRESAATKRRVSRPPAATTRATRATTAANADGKPADESDSSSGITHLATPTTTTPLMLAL
jgi:hypothetical protein